MPKTILVANSKGGVGKTTIASELAYAARNSGLTFDYHDLDRQGGSSFGISRTRIPFWPSWTRRAI